MKNIRIFYLKIFLFSVVKFSIYLNRRVFVMGYRNRKILVTLNLHVPQSLPSNFSSIRLTLWEMSFEEFQDGQDGSHFGY